jgi:uncharacterized protein
MTTIKAFIKRHPLLSFFALTFAITWGLFVLALGPGGIPATKEQFTTLPLGAILSVLVGPSVSGILLTGLVYGRAGFRDLFTKMTRWRVGARWYAVALLTAPLVFAAVLVPLSLISPVFLPSIIASDDKASVLLFGIAVGLGAGFFEELGWTGFAVPTLLKLRHGVLGTGLFVGVLWGVWHFLTSFWGSGTTSGAFSLAIFVPGVLFAVGILPAYRVLMVWVYDRTGSLLVAMLMHASLTASMLVLGPLATGAALATYELVLAAALWVFVAAVAAARGGHLTRQPPLRRRVA